MEVKPSFFSISGFLVPGIVTTLASTSIWASYHQTELLAAVKFSEQHSLEGGASFVFGIVVIAILIAITFVLGCALSDIYIFIARSVVLKYFLRKRVRAYFAKLSEKASLKDLLLDDVASRETYAFATTCGLDLHWYAGRIRMVGGSSVGLLFASMYASWCGGIERTACWLAGGAFAGIVIATYRSYKFDVYMAAVAAFLQFQGDSKLECSNSFGKISLEE